MDIVDPDSFFEDFPRLKSSNYKVTSEATPPARPWYNCAALVLGEKSNFWWPYKGHKWFPGVTKDGSLESLMLGLAIRGFRPCPDGRLEREFEKIAIYVMNGEPQHVAIQLGNGRWKSKIGENVDIHHQLHSLEGPLYGVVARFMKRRRSH